MWKTLNGTDRHTDSQTNSDESGRGLRNHYQDCPLLTVRRLQRILYRAVTNIMLYLEANDGKGSVNVLNLVFETSFCLR